MPIKQAEIMVRGIVQGVNYRYNTKEIADKLGVVGWVKNMSDGSVKIIAQGEKEKIDEFLAWCKKGSDISKVEDVKIDWKELDEGAETYDGFKIEY